MDFQELHQTSGGTSRKSDLAVEALFPTLVISRQVTNSSQLNASLLSAILEERASDPVGLQLSNVSAMGSWHSRNSLHEDIAFEPLVNDVEKLAQAISERLAYHSKLKLCVDQMWAVVNPPGASNAEHVHPLSLWSGVYYVNVPEHSGMLRLADPRPGNVMFCGEHRADINTPDEVMLARRFQPKEGLLMFFPGFVPHSVDPNLSKLGVDAGSRVAVSFNLTQHWKG